MVRITKKAKIEPVREANELWVANEYPVEAKKEETAPSVKAAILEDVKKVSISKQGAGMSDKLNCEEIEAILNKYL